MNLLVADQRIMRGVAATLTWQYVDENGAPADPGVVTIGITKADGSTLVAAGTATAGSGTAARTYTLPVASNLTLELLTVTWQLPTAGPAFTTLVEICGGFYFTLIEARAADTSLRDTDKYPDEDLIRVRHEVEAECEMICDVAFMPRYRRVRVDGDGTSDLILLDNQLRTIRSVRTYTSATAYTAFTAGELADLTVDDDLVVHRPYGSTFDNTRKGNIVVECEHGYNRPPPDLKEQTLVRLRHRLTTGSSGILDRATSFQAAADQGGGMYRLSTPEAFKTGINSVDAAYARYSRRDFGGGGARPASRSIDMNPQRDSLFHGPRR